MFSPSILHLSHVEHQHSVRDQPHPRGLDHRQKKSPSASLLDKDVCGRHVIEEGDCIIAVGATLCCNEKKHVPFPNHSKIGTAKNRCRGHDCNIGLR
jgi:hypothetical protein